MPKSKISGAEVYGPLTNEPSECNRPCRRDLGSAGVPPSSATIRGFRDADFRAVDPGETGQLCRAGPAIGIEHEPFLPCAVPNECGISGPVKHRVTEQGPGRDFAALLKRGSQREGQ